MNYKYSSILLILATLLSCVNKNIIVQNYEPEKIIHARQTKPTDSLNNYAFYLNEGDSIPIKINLDTEILDISHEKIILTLKRKIYFRLKIPESLNIDDIPKMNEEEIAKLSKEIKVYFSPDAIKWAPYNDIKAVHQLFGIKHGSFSFGMGGTKDEGLTMFLNVKTTHM